MNEKYEGVMDYIAEEGLAALVNVCREIAAVLKFDLSEAKREIKRLNAERVYVTPSCFMLEDEPTDRTELLEKVMDDAEEKTELLYEIFARLDVVGVVCRKDGEETPVEIMVMNAGRKKS